MTTVSTTKYIMKKFNNYSFQVNKFSGYFSAMNLLDTYNNNFEKQKKQKDMIKYMKRPKFSRQIESDFNSITTKKLIDYPYLNKLCKLEDIKISKTTPTEDIVNLSYEIKYKYMVREISKSNGSCKKILSLDVHPMVAVGIAMWLSPVFSSEVKDIFLRHLNGDSTLIKETIQNTNKSSGKINNIQTTTNPETNEVTVLVKTYDKNDIVAKIEDKKLRSYIENLLAEKEGLIAKNAEKDCKISNLMDRLDISEKLAEERFQKLLEINKQANGHVNNLIGKLDVMTDYNEKTHKKINEVTDKLNEVTDDNEKTHKKLDDVITKVEEIRHNVVSIEKDDPDYPQVYILRKSDAKEDDHNFYAMRCQTRSFNTQVNRLKNKYGKHIRRTFTIKQPNAIIFWKQIKKDLINDDKLVKGNGNWFSLNDMTRREFKNLLNEKNNQRIDII